MIKRKVHLTYCETCKTEHYIDDKDEIICDTCGNPIFDYCEIGKITRIKLDLNETEYHFDTLQCLFRFVMDELKKENKEDRFEYGKEKE